VSILRRLGRKVLPERFLAWNRRRRALRRYLRQLAYEVYGRQVRLDLQELEGRIAARRDGFYQQIVREVLDRTDLILQELDRRIEGLNARHGAELRRLRDEVSALRDEVTALRGQTVGIRNLDAGRPPPDTEPAAVE
jgi:chromosome condensin MukBEF ATPase and DNA-binding subunit MukB